MDVLMGDLHGNFAHLDYMIRKNPRWSSVTIVGDVGLGFPNTFQVPFKSSIPIRFIRGNHDNPEFIRNLPEEWAGANWHYIPDGHFENNTLYLGGAWSIDKADRTPGMNWWYDEEIGLDEQIWIMEKIIKIRDTGRHIAAIVSHDGPLSITRRVGHFQVETDTGKFLEYLRDKALTGKLKPKFWYFGHYHRHFLKTIGGTVFKCIKTGDTTVPPFRLL
jgi:hypothetical protein